MNTISAEFTSDSPHVLDEWIDAVSEITRKLNGKATLVEVTKPLDTMPCWSETVDRLNREWQAGLRREADEKYAQIMKDSVWNTAMNPGPEPEEDVLEEALRITTGDRQAQYGPPNQDFARTANMWSALFADKLSKSFEARDVAMAMILLKLSRETHKRKRDSAVDIAGYARCLHICNQADELRQQKES